MKRKPLIIISIIVLSLAILSFFGILITGATIGWGPFSFIYFKNERVRVMKENPYDENQNGIVFYGASNFRLWHEMENDLSEYPVTNCGFGGSTDQLLVKYAEDLLYAYHPKVVFFQTGSNDYVSIKGTEEEKIEKCMEYKKEMFNTFHQNLPDATFVIMSGLLLPGRSEYTSLTIKINEELKKFADSYDYIYFIDASEMTYSNNTYKKELFIKDGIHLNHDGQLIWCNEYIKPMLEEIWK